MRTRRRRRSKPKKTARGGARPNAGRKSAFPGIESKPFSMDFTEDGRDHLARLQRRTGLSRNEILAHLAGQHAHELVFAEPGVVYHGKVGRTLGVFAIRLPSTEGNLLRAARDRTGKSYSDLGEALVRTYGDNTIYPGRPTTERDKRPPRPRRA